MSSMSIEKEEQIIQNLEELDSTFSSIKSNLREMKMKIGRFAQTNKKLSADLEPWVTFFETEKKEEISPLSEMQLNSFKFCNVTGSPDVMSNTAPRNPFIEQNSSDLLNRSIFKDFKSSGIIDSSSMMILNKSKLNNYDAEPVIDSDENHHNLSPFTYSKVPDIFHQEHELKQLYDFVAKNRTVSIEDICKNFDDLQPGKLEIFINLLCRKNFIRQENNYLSIEK